MHDMYKKNLGGKQDVWKCQIHEVLLMSGASAREVAGKCVIWKNAR
jgi:hypothetical protein